MNIKKIMLFEFSTQIQRGSFVCTDLWRRPTKFSLVTSLASFLSVAKPSSGHFQNIGDCVQLRLLYLALWTRRRLNRDPDERLRVRAMCACLCMCLFSAISSVMKHAVGGRPPRYVPARPGLQVVTRYTSSMHMERWPLLYVHVSLPVQPTKAAWWPWPLTFWAWKWCPSHVWRGLPLCQFLSSYASLFSTSAHIHDRRTERCQTTDSIIA